jgi:hypothetical protein
MTDRFIASTPHYRFGFAGFRKPGATLTRQLVFAVGLVAGVLTVSTVLTSIPLAAAETIWLEAEHLQGVRGYCWPMGRPEMKRTDGHWALSGPGWSAEWNQGGESGFLSIATAADDDRAVAHQSLEIPVDGTYQVWVRYGDWREKSERFELRIEQSGAAAWSARFGEHPRVEEDNEMKLYFGWAFAWDRATAELRQGPARLSLVSYTTEAEPRQIDVIVLTTDADYRPLIKERPVDETRRLLETWREQQFPADSEPFARRQLTSADKTASPALPAEWKLRTFRDRGFLYLWNVGSHTNAEETWLSDTPDRVKFPYNIIDAETRAEFEKLYGGRDDVPIYSDPRIVPTFHGVGAGVFATDAQTGDVQSLGRRFANWLDQSPGRAWAMMMNYHGGQPIGEAGVALFQKYRDRYVGSISGESLGYFYPAVDAMKAATESARTRRELVQSFVPLTLAENAEKYRKVYGRDLDANPYQDVIACLSVGNIAFVPLCYDWGARTAGYESSAMTYSLLGMRWAFMRGAARQHAGLTATYRSCNFGDASTIFSNGGSFHTPQNILDNYYSVYSGAGVTWYKFDIWYQYMAGSSMFYHEQGFDEFWRPGGTSAAGIQPVQLSPKGKLVDRFLRVTADSNFDRGHPYTPVAFLVDYAHGWEPSPFWPNAFKNWHQHEDRFLHGDHEQMLREYFSVAYHPIVPESEKPITAINEVHVPGVFGDIFDVIFAYPDAAKWRTIDTYPVVIAAGDIELTAEEGRRLAQYVERGGTLLLADEHLSGPGRAALLLPAVGNPQTSDSYHWLDAAEQHPCGRFRFQPIDASDGRVLARAGDRQPFCVALDRGQGRIIYLSVPRGLTITRQAHPVVARLLMHLTRNLMPVSVTGDVQWMVNRSEQGWVVLLLNPSGQDKPQHGITATDYRQNRRVRIHCQVPVGTARDRLSPAETLSLVDGVVEVEVPAGAVRLVELR